MINNLALWESVYVTDPSQVKKITGKQYQGSSPNPYYLIEKATKKFGPIGIGWGVTVKSERFERLSDTDVLHVAVVSVWYVLDGKRSETFDQMGGTKAAYMTGKGTILVDEDAGKKSVTDGMVKCLSMIGFAGDIFSGLWDDSKYVDYAAEETARLAEIERQRKIPRITKEQSDEISELAVEAGVSNEQLFGMASKASKMNVDSFDSIPADLYARIKKWLVDEAAKRNA